MGFREENTLLIYITSFFGLYLRSLETITSNKWKIAFFTIWSKIPVAVFPVYLGYDFYSLFVDEDTLLGKLAMLRKVVAFGMFFLKNIIFYTNRRKIENLFDCWDAAFKEEFFPEKDLLYQKRNKERHNRLLRLSITLAVLASICYSGPAYFSKNKTFTHPSGFIYPHRSPDFEIIVTFDFICTMSAVSAAAFDCILIVLLSNVQSKLKFLRDTLRDMINELYIDSSGRLMAIRNEKKQIIDDYTEEEMDEAPFDLTHYEETVPHSTRFRNNIADVDAKLRIWILHHQQAISVFEELKKVYATTATIELGYVVVYTSLMALQLVQVKPGPVVVGIAMVASCNLMSLFFWSKLGSELQNIHLFGEAFGSAWFLFPRKIQTALLFISQRSRKPLTLYGIVVYAINLATFFDIMKLTYQFFAAMTQVTEKEE